MRYFFLTLLFSIQAFLCAAQANVLYGERNLQRDIPAVFFDRDGNIYPDYFIADSSLAKSKASLGNWYAEHPADFVKICSAYGCAISVYSDEALRILNDSITASVKRVINARSGVANSVTFMVHGYRKTFFSQNGDSPSPRDYSMLQATLNNFDSWRTNYVAVYWDGMYGTFSRNLRHNKELIKLFVIARGSAANVGGGLRRLMAGLSFDTLNVITHSLGAEVACSALFDTSKFKSVTPANKVVNICLVAPAVAGIDRFKFYLARNPPIDTAADNYRLAIVYNSKDFVLKKRVGIFGPGPYRYGNTTLGCNYHGAATKLRDYFSANYRNSEIYLLDLTGKAACHHMSCYDAGDNFKPLVEFIKNIP